MRRALFVGLFAITAVLVACVALKSGPPAFRERTAPDGDAAATGVAGPTRLDGQPAEGDRGTAVHGRGSVTGVVRESGSDRPLAGLDVSIAPGNRGRHTRTGADGAFAFDDVPAGVPWTLAVAPDDLHDGATVASLRVADGGTTDVGAIVVAVATGVGGVVVDDEGRAAAGATVDAARLEIGLGLVSVRAYAEGRAAPPIVATARAGEDGRFRLGGLTPGRYELTARRVSSGVAVAPNVLVFERATPPVRLVLGALHRVDGRVVRGDGRSVEGLDVIALPDEDVLGLSVGSTLRFPARTGADGAFAIDGIPDGTWRFVVQGDGWSACGHRRHRVPEDGSVELRFAGRSSLVGRVTGPDARAVSCAAVVLYAENAVRVVTTRGDGHYEVPALEEAGVNFAVTADGFAPWPDVIDLTARSAPNQIEIGPGVNVRDVALAHGGAVRGLVVAADGGDPQAGVRIQAVSLHFLAGWAPSAVTGDDGRFEIRGLPACPILLLATKRGRVQRGAPQALAALDRAKSGTPDGNIVLAADGAVAEVRLLLDPAPVVRGRVVAPDGRDVPFATVRLRPGSGSKEELEYMFGRMSGTAGPDGRFEVPLPLALDDVEILAAAPGYHDGSAKGSVPGARAPTTDIDVRLPLGAAIEGRVVSRGGGALDGAELRVKWSNSRWCEPRPEAVTVRTDADGTFRVADLDPGEWSIDVRHPRARQATHFVTAPEGETVREDLSLAPALVVSGRVLRPDASPAVGATVQFSMNGEVRFWKEVGPDGTFRCESLDCGAWVIGARASGYAPAAARTVDADAEDVVLQLGVPFTVSGVVFWRGAGPLTGAAVLAVPFRGTGGKLVTNLGADGSFRLEDLARGPHELSVWWSITSWQHRSVRLARPVTADGGSEGVSIEALPGFALAGRVVLDDGTPVRSGSVTVERIAAPEVNPLLPGEEDLVRPHGSVPILDGKFACDALAPGTYRVAVYSSGAPERSLTATTDGRDLTIRLCAGCTLRGRITARDGAPAGGARVYVRTDGVSGEQSASADAMGVFAVENVTCGNVRVFAEWQSSRFTASHTAGPVVAVRHGEDAAPVEFQLSEKLPTAPRPAGPPPPPR